MIRTRSDAARTARPGFTLVELMVSAAIVVIIMAILATAFQAGVETTRQMRSAGDMMGQLRAAAAVIKADLAAPHFLPQSGKPNNGQGVSSQQIDQVGTANWTAAKQTAPRGGFFRIVSPAAVVEGLDANGLQSTRATNHLLHFTTVTIPSDKYTVTLTNGTVCTSQAAEIAYFLTPMNPPAFTNPGNANSLQMYQLVRHQLLVAKDAGEQSQAPLSQAHAAAGDTNQQVVSWSGQPYPNPNGRPNQLSDLVGPGLRMATFNAATVPTLPVPTGSAPTFTQASARYGDDVLLSHVLSFEVRPTWLPTPGKNNGPRPFGYGTSAGTDSGGSVTDHPFDTLAPQLTGGEYDTRPTPPAAIRVTAVQIKLRVWDPKMKAGRQITIVQDL